MDSEAILGWMELSSRARYDGDMDVAERTRTVGQCIERAWRARPTLPAPVVDAALALLLTVLLLVEGGTGQRDLSPAGLLTTAPLAWRRRRPLLVFGPVVVGAMATLPAAQYTIFTCILIATYSVGAYSRHRLLSLGVMVITAIVVVMIFGGGGLPSIPYAAVPFTILLPLWLVGHAMRIQRERALAFADRADRLAREREEATRAALAEERSRIARELHDVVAHSVSVMVVQAGAARQVLFASPEQAREALLAIERSGREAMTELRHLLGLLSADGADLALAPQPGAEQIGSLLARVRAAGLPVELHVEGQARPLPPGLDLAVYRLVQEALTNALKHAGLARTAVILDYREAELKVEILDEGDGETRTGAGRGHGLVGMRERMALYGGTIEAGPRLGRGYAVRAWLPLENGRT